MTALQNEVHQLASKPALSATDSLKSLSDNDSFMKSIEEKLDILCSTERELQSKISHHTSAHQPPHEQPDSQFGSNTFCHDEKQVAFSQAEYIDEETEKELIAFFDSCRDKFKSENGRSCLSYGEQYHYSGARSSKNPVQEVPQVISSLIDRVNKEFCPNNQPQINSCLVNRYEGPDSSLPQHSDDEHSIHPESSILTLSLGASCTLTFTEIDSKDTHDHLCLPRSIYSMTRRSQEFFSHGINTGSIANETRYSITLRSVSFENRNATCIIGDSNTGGLRFGTDFKKSFGHWLPGQQFYAPVISEINPYVTCGYKNVVILCGINDLKKPDIKNLTDIRHIYNSYVNKIEYIQAVNPKAHIYVCPTLPTKLAELNRKAICFNRLICTELLPSNFGVSFVDGFDGFLDRAGILSQHLSRSLDKHNRTDYLHLNWKGIAKLGVLIRNTVLLRLNGGVDKRRSERVNGRMYNEVTGGRTAAAESGQEDGYQS